MSFQYYTTLSTIANTIMYYPVLVALPIGILGNVFSFFIYTRPNLNKKTNTGFLYGLLCILNIIFMLYFTLVFQSSNLFKYTVTLPCGLVTYLLRIAFCLVPWMQVIISFDRFIVVVYPLKKKFMSKKWILCLIMLGILAFIGVGNMANLLSYPVTYFGWFTFCVQSNQSTAAANIVSIFLRAYIPFTLMLVLDIIVFKRLRNSRRRVGVTQMGQRKQTGQFSNKEYNFIISTIFIDLTFILFYTPISAHVTITVVNLYVSWDLNTAAGFNLYYNCALLVVYLYSVVLLFIFVIFNRYFRSEAFHILRLNKILPDISQTVMETASKSNAKTPFNNQMKKSLY